MPIKDITHMGKKIISIDFEGCRSKQDMLDMAYQTMDYLLAQSENHLRIFFDYSHGFATREYMKVAQEGREKLLKTKTTTSAAIGISGIKKVLLQGYNAVSTSKGIKPFDSRGEALDYLVSDEN